MARINFEDDVEAQDEFWRLLEVIGNRDMALGKLLRFFRIAQKAFGYDQPMSEQELTEKGFGDMILSGWAVPTGSGYQALGAEKHFAWYRQVIERAAKGGEANRKKQEEKRAGLLAGIQQSDSPLSLALAPSLALSQKQIQRDNKKVNLSEDIKNCIFDWKKTLEHFGIQRPITPRDEIQIGAAVQRFGASWVSLAFCGARKQIKSEKWNPAQFVSLSSYLDKDRIERLVNIGAGKENSTTTDWEKVFA